MERSMSEHWRVIEDCHPSPNKISLIINNRVRTQTHTGFIHSVNAKNNADLGYFLREKLITNLEYLEGLELLRAISNEY